VGNYGINIQWSPH